MTVGGASLKVMRTGNVQKSGMLSGLCDVADVSGDDVKNLENEVGCGDE